MKLAITLALTLSIASCGPPPHWEKGGTSDLDRRTARYECDRDSRSGHYDNDFSGDLARGMAFKECMEIRGWTLVRD